MSKLVEVARVSEIKDGTAKEVMVQGREILLAKAGDEYYAADNHCPHMGGKLTLGKLEGTIVTCPRHGSQFDLSDGHVVRWLKGSGLLSTIGKALKSPRPLATYDVKVEDDKVMIRI